MNGGLWHQNGMSYSNERKKVESLNLKDSKIYRLILYSDYFVSIDHHLNYRLIYLPARRFLNHSPPALSQKFQDDWFYRSTFHQNIHFWWIR